MSSFTLRAVRASLAFGAVALTACSDLGQTTAPPRSLAPRFGVGDVITVTNTSGGTELGSLRWALSLVTGGEIIRFDPSLAGATIVLDSTAVVNRSVRSVTIEGPADKGITLSGGGKWRVFEAELLGPTVLRNMTIRDGKVPTDIAGAAILAGDLTLDHVTVTNNHGGHSTVKASYVKLTNSTVSGNTTSGTSSPVVVQGSSLLGSVTLVNSTITFNSGRGIVADKRILENSLLAHNTGTNCSHSFGIEYRGKSFADDTTCGNINVMLVGDPKLDSLRDNGGPSPTHAFDPSSPVLNAGQNCSVTVDQRYAPRDTQCDIGAFEFLDYTQVTLTVDGATSVNQTTGGAVVTGTVKCSRAGPVSFGLTVALKQVQKVGRGSTVVDGTGSTAVECTTTARTWSAAVTAATGSFAVGSGEAAVQTANTPGWVTPSTTASPVKLFWARR